MATWFVGISLDLFAEAKRTNRFRTLVEALFYVPCRAHCVLNPLDNDPRGDIKMIDPDLAALAKVATDPLWDGGVTIRDIDGNLMPEDDLAKLAKETAVE